MSAFVAGCSKDDADVGFNPNASVDDPSGTVAVSMRNDGGSYLENSNIYIDAANNFAGGSFVSLGKVKGLGNVTIIPKIGWANKIAVTPGEGVVAYYNNTFYRIYVVDYLESVLGGIIGAEVRYQTPFFGSGEIVLAENKVEIPKEGGSVEVLFKNDNLVVFDLAAENCEAWEIRDSGFLPVGITVSSNRNDGADLIGKVVITSRADNRTTELQVVVKGAEPYCHLADNANVKCISGIYTMDASETNIVSNAFSYTYGADWLSDAGWQDGKLKFAYAANMGNSTRTASITVTAPEYGFSKEIKVTQSAFELLVLDETGELSSVNFPRLATYKLIKIGPEGLSGIECSSSNPEWCSITSDPEGWRVRVGENTTGTDRQSSITIKYGNTTKSIPVNQGKYAVGDTYAENNLTGVVFWVDGHHGKIRTKESLGYAYWSTENVLVGATDENDGMANTKKVQALLGWETLYPAFALCAAHGDGWYLPAINELKEFGSYGGSEAWSSTEIDATRVYCYESRGYWYDRIKNQYAWHVYPIHTY